MTLKKEQKGCRVMKIEIENDYISRNFIKTLRTSHLRGKRERKCSEQFDSKPELECRWND